MLRSTARGALSALLSFAFLASAAAQDSGNGPAALPAPPSLMSRFDVSAATVQSLQVPVGSPAVVAVDVVIAGRPMRFELAPHDVRAPGFQLIENGPAGPQLMPAPPCTTYRGHIAGDVGSAVAATVDGGSITAYARTGGGELWVVQPVRQVQPAAGPGLHIVFRGVDSVQLPVQCGVNALGLPAPAVGGVDLVYVADLAIEADYPFYQLNGSSTTNTQNDVTGIVNAMNVIYERDTSIRLQVSRLIVDSSPDAYTTSSASTLLSQFRSRWNSVNAGVQRDLAHLFTGRNIGAASGGTIGIAYLGVVCNIGSAYGLSQSRFTSNYSYRVAVTAHEIGHNFGAGHCNSSPPCNIMCSGIGGCNNNPSSFGTAARNQIIGYRQSVGCLTAQATAPVITSVSPTTVKTVNPGYVTLTGSGFIGTNRINVGPTWVASGIQVVSDTQLRFPPPSGLPLGVHVINAVNQAGTSNNSALLYTAANPAELVVPHAVLGGTTASWSMGGWTSDFAFLVISLQGTSSPWLGFNLVDSPVVLWQGLLDTRGMAAYSFPVPSGVLNGVRVYSQLIDIVGGGLTVRSLSDIESTLIVL